MNPAAWDPSKGQYVGPWIDTQGVDKIRATFRYLNSPGNAVLSIEESVDGVEGLFGDRAIVAYTDIPLVGRYVRLKGLGPIGTEFQAVVRAVS